MNIRKQVYDLTLEDLRRFPIWEYALDEEAEAGQDEATVRPVASDLAEPGNGNTLVRAIFRLADGSEMCGYMTPPTEDDASLAHLQPVVVTNAGQVGFYCGAITPTPENLAKEYATLGRSPAQVFPIDVVSDAQFAGAPVRTTVAGFVVLEDWKTGKTKLVK